MSETRLQIENGVVVNVIVVNPDAVPSWAEGWPVAPEGVGIGWTLDGEVFVPPLGPDPAEVLAAARAAAVLTRPELAFQMGKLGFLPILADRQAFSRGEIPTPLETMIAALAGANDLDADTQERLLLLMAGATQFPRVDPFWSMAVAAEIVTEAQLDAAYGIASP